MQETMNNVKYHINLIILFIATIIIPCTVSAKEAKTGEYSVFYTTGLNFLELMGVERADTATVLKIRCTGVPGDYFRIPRKLYLDDEKGQRYPLKQAVGVKLSDDTYWSLSEIVEFELHFAPLAKECKVFDLRTAGEMSSSFSLWGIHPRKMNLEKLCKYKDTLVLTDSTIMKSGPVTIIGKIENFSTDIYPDSLISAIHRSGERPQIAHIAEDGTFEVRHPALECPSWQYLELKLRNIPVFLVPGDTLLINMDQLFTVNESIEYKSKTGQNIMQNLLKADPKFKLWENYNMRAHRMRPSELNALVPEERASANRLCGYLKWKHKLSELEAHLLYIDMTSTTNEIYQSILYYTMKSACSSPEIAKMSPEGYFTFATSNEMTDIFRFLRMHNLNDYSYFMTPYQEFIGTLTLIPTISRDMNQAAKERKIDILESYFGYEFNNALKRVIKKWY